MTSCVRAGCGSVCCTRYMRWRVMLFLAVWLLAGVSNGTAQSESSPEQELAKGWQAYESGDYRQAFEVLSDAVRIYPGDEAINFALGQAAYAAGKLSHALFAYDRVLLLNPNNQRARLDKARTCFMMEQYEQARSQFLDVLETQPPADVDQNIRQFLDAIEERTCRYNWDSSVLTGVFYDDNINYGLASDLIDSEAGVLEVESSSLPGEAWGLAWNAGGNLRTELGERDCWSAAMGASAYMTFLNDYEEQEIGYYRVAAHMQWSDLRSYADFMLRGDHLDYGHSSLLNVTGFDPTWVYMIDSHWRSTTEATVEYRDYTGETDRDALYCRLGEKGHFIFGEQMHSVSLGCNGFYEASENESYGNRGWEADAGIRFHLPLHLTLFSDLSYRQTRYHEELFPDLQSSPRQDDMWQSMSGLEWNSGGIWGIEFNYRRVHNNSNFGLYEYRRNVYTLNCLFRF